MSFRKLNLDADNATEQRILDYLLENASFTLCEKINAGKKTLAGAMEYAKGEARKLADGGNSICVEDKTVFGWIVHFFEEDEIKEPAKQGPRVAGGKKKKLAKKPEPKKEKIKGPVILDLFTGEEVSAR